MLLLAFAGGASAAVSAQVDRERIALSESFELTIRVAGSMRAAEPDLAPLDRHFEVLGSKRNSSFTMSNGRSESSTTWQVTLMARHAGELTIPAIEVGGERTQPIAIRVSEDPAPASAAAREVQLQVETDAAEVHVQQQLLLTVRLLHAVDFERGATLEAPEIPDAVVRELGENSYEKLIDGRRYGVFERRYAVFPQRSGELVVPALGFQAALGGGGWFDRSGGRGRMLRLRSEEKRIRVLPPEAGATPWLPARVLTVIETWDRSPQELRVGDSATRTVTITATGLTGAQLPPLPAPAVEGLRFYPDQPRIEDAQDAEGITGTRIESSAVIPSRAGDIEFPEIRVRWWDTGKQRFEEAVVPRRSIRVLPGANAAPAPAPLAGAQPGASAAAPAAAAGSATSAAPAQPSPPPAAPPWPWIIATLLLALSTAFSSWQWRRLALATPPSAAEPAGGVSGHSARGAIVRDTRRGLPRQRRIAGAGAAAALGTRRLPARRHSFGQRPGRHRAGRGTGRAHRAPAGQPLRRECRALRTRRAPRAPGSGTRCRARAAQARHASRRIAAAVCRAAGARGSVTRAEPRRGAQPRPALRGCIDGVGCRI